MNRIMKLTVGLISLAFALAACAPQVPMTTSPSATPGINSHTRFGTTKIEPVGASGVSGTFVAQDNGDGTTQVSVQLDHAGDVNPWGIHATGDCQNGVPENTRPIFSLADIELGHKEEIIETAAYESVPGDLIVIIYGIAPDGSQQMVACANLGMPQTANGPSPTALATSDCVSAQPRPFPTPSTDGWLAFSGTHNNTTDIYILAVDAALKKPDQATAKRLTTDPAVDFDPTWSPDGTQITFRSQRDGNDEIYIMTADGTCQTNLTHDPGDDWSPAWSPDGKWIAFAHLFEGNSFTDIVVVNVDGSGFQRLTDASGEYPDWSPDGTQIAFASTRDGNYEIYVMNADGTKQTRLTNDPAYDMSPAWSPDGKRIAFDTQRDYYPPAEVGIGPEYEIHIINADGSDDTRLTNNRDEDRFPTWGANGLIAFTRNGDLFVMKPDGSDQTLLFNRDVLQLDSNTFAAWWPVH